MYKFRFLMVLYYFYEVNFKGLRKDHDSIQFYKNPLTFLSTFSIEENFNRIHLGGIFYGLLHFPNLL